MIKQISKIKDWTKDSWKKLRIKQQPEYLNKEKLIEVTDSVNLKIKNY